VKTDDPPADRGHRATFLIALALLAANDWIFKPAALLPAALTGKLSDLAGMVVAPVVLAASLAALRLPARWAAPASAIAVGTVFAAIKLWEPAARLHDGALTAAMCALDLPLSAHTAVDATDLLALPLLLPAVGIARSLAHDGGWRGGAVAALGMLACAATSFAGRLVLPHWGFADARLGSTFAQPLDGAGVLVRLGRQSDDGRFEIDLQLTAGSEAVAVSLTDIQVDLGLERVRAATLSDGALRMTAGPHRTEVARIYFVPAHPGWAAATRGALSLPLEIGGRPRPLQIPLTFEERVLPWPDIQQRFLP
jgi:hypothetical protein